MQEIKIERNELYSSTLNFILAECLSTNGSKRKSALEIQFLVDLSFAKSKTISETERFEVILSKAEQILSVEEIQKICLETDWSFSFGNDSLESFYCRQINHLMRKNYSFE